MKAMKIKAVPVSIKYTDEQGYSLTVRITKGPQNLLDRVVTVVFTAAQLNELSDWEPVMSQDRSFSASMYFTTKAPSTEDKS